MKQEKIKKSELIAVAKELNEVLGLDPPIATKKTHMTDLITNIMEGGALVDPQIDELSEETTVILIDLLILKDEKRTPEKEEPEKEEPEKEEPEKEEPEKEEPEKKQEETKKKESKPPRRTRASIMATILETTKDPMTRLEMNKLMQSEYGGSENEAKSQVGIFIQLLIATGHIIELEDKKLKYTKQGV